MASRRIWTVRSNSYGPDFPLVGDTAIAAIEAGFGAIAADLRLGGADGYRLLSVDAQYQGSILDGRGGIELTIVWTDAPAGRKGTGDRNEAIVWVTGRPDDMPEPHRFDLVPATDAA